MDTNVLYYGDNLDILRGDYIPDESVDLIYLDPPFNSNRAYNVIFKDESGNKSDAQIEAFDDTWHWGPHIEQTYHYLTNTSSHQGEVSDAVSAVVGALRKGIRPSPMLAYLVEMAVRLVNLRRVLKRTGTLWLHCDPTASHYLKVVLDAIFGPDAFKNEVIWLRTPSKGLMTKRLPTNHDVLLVYGKTEDAEWNLDEAFIPYDMNALDEKTALKYRYKDPDGRVYRLSDLSNPNPDRPNLTYEFLGITRVWRWTEDRMQKAYDKGLIVQTKPGTVPQLKRYLDEQRGRPIGDVWTDISPINSRARERLGYPTQKPTELLERIVRLSTEPGDVVLDPFCGCGTALVAAQKTGRKWVGIDITYLSIAVMRSRLRGSFPEMPAVHVAGQPTEVEGARMLAKQSLDDRYEFQYWALSLVDAQPVGGVKKKGADKGMDGIITFSDVGGEVRRIIVEVKSGGVGVKDVGYLISAMDGEDSPLGVFITLEEPTKPMLSRAAEAGIYHSELANRDYPKVQILTIEELLRGKKPELPLLVMPTYQQAEKVQSSPGQIEAFG